MTDLSVLWLPIVLSAVLVFVVSSIIHMATPWHRNDFPRMPNEDRVRDALRPFAIPPGDYMVPKCDSMAEMKSPEFAEKLRQGPVLMATVMPNGMMAIQKSLVLWFIYSLVVGLLAAYVAGRALPPGVPYMRVFQIVSVAAFLGYAAALWQMSIWYCRSWEVTLKSTVDGAVYALLTAGCMAWLWPR